MVKVDILPGTNIEHAVLEAKRLARKIDFPVKFHFNGVLMIVFSHSDEVSSVESYYKEIKFLKSDD